MSFLFLFVIHHCLLPLRVVIRVDRVILDCLEARPALVHVGLANVETTQACCSDNRLML